jgi:hypothetical protein
MKIYLAARYSRYPEMCRHRADLQRLGHWVTSRWIDGNHSMDNGVSIQASDAERSRFAREDHEDLRTADCVISFTEEPRAKVGSRGGRHVEFGMAVELGKRLLVVGYRENVFHWLPGVEFYPTWDEALAMLSEEALAWRPPNDGRGADRDARWVKP